MTHSGTDRSNTSAPAHFSRRPIAVAIQASLISLGLACASVQAATITVDNSGDVGEGCTFREAVERVNAAGALDNGCSASVRPFGDMDTILFDVDSVDGLTSDVTINRDLIINPNGDTVSISSAGDDRVISVSNSTVSFNRVVISGGRTVIPESGGGLYIENSTVTITNSTIQDNRSRTFPDFVVLGVGGGVFSEGSELTLINSTVTGNSSAQSGGGVYSRYSQLNVINSTVSGNTGASRGGGIHLGVNASMNMVNSTVSNNTETYGNGGGISLNGDSASASISNSIIIGNRVTRASRSGNEISSPSSRLVNSESNLLGGGPRALNNVTPSDSDIIVDLSSTSLNRVIAPLAFNGGPTLTHALAARSPAIDAADTSLCDAEPINNLDQRGEPRDESCDIGAFEFIEEDGTFFVIPTVNGKNVIVEL